MLSEKIIMWKKLSRGIETDKKRDTDNELHFIVVLLTQPAPPRQTQTHTYMRDVRLPIGAFPAVNLSFIFSLSSFFRRTV